MGDLLTTSPWARSLRYVDHAAGGEVFFGPRAPALLPEDPANPDPRVTVDAGTRLGLLAHDAWDRADLWWVIADCNEVVDPFNLTVGDELRIPPLDRVLLEVIV